MNKFYKMRNQKEKEEEKTKELVHSQGKLMKKQLV